MPRARAQVLLARWFWLLSFLGVVVMATPSSMSPPLLQIPIGKTITANWSALDNNQLVENKVIHVALISCGAAYRSLTFNAIKSIVLSSRGSATIRFHINRRLANISRFTWTSSSFPRLLRQSMRASLGGYTFFKRTRFLRYFKTILNE